MRADRNDGVLPTMRSQIFCGVRSAAACAAHVSRRGRAGLAALGPAALATVAPHASLATVAIAAEAPPAPPSAPSALVRSFSVASPVWLLAGLAVLVVLGLALRAADRRRRRDLAKIATSTLLADLTRSLSPRRRTVRRALLLGGVGLAFVALARPELGFTWVESKRRGIDVMIAVDASKSMLARDVSPDRLTRAKLGVSDLLERLDGDRVGLIAFAGSAFLQVPLTLDEGAFRRALLALEPGIIPRGGSDLASAIRIAVRAFRTEKSNFKLLVLLSDGEDLAGDAIQAATEAADAGVKIYTVGVGTSGGELIPDGDKPGKFVEDTGGKIVKSRLDEQTLREIAERTAGFYAPLGQRGEGVTAVYEKALAPIPEEELASRLRRVPIDRFQWPLALAILLLAIEPLVGDRKPRGRAARVSRAAAIAALALLATISRASADDAAAGADPEELYRQERYQDSLEGYREAAKADPEDPRRHLNVGAAAYKAGDYGAAAEAFAESLAAEEKPLQSQAFYNLGNTQYRLGEETQATNPESTKEAWQQAIAAYEEALRVNDKDEDARFNRDFVKKKLEELEKNPPPSPKPSPQPSPQPSSSPSPGDSGGEGENGDGSQQPSPSPGGATPPTPPAPTPSTSDSPGGQPSPSPAPQDAPSPSAGGGDPNEDAKDSEGSPPEPRPGQMSPDEAEDLLDSLSGDEPSLPAMVESGEPPKPEDERDW